MLPLFIHDGEGKIEIKSMPGCHRLSLQDMMEEVQGAVEDGIVAVEVFPAIDDSLKTADGAESFNPEGLVPRAIRMLKARWTDLIVVSDVALDPYSSDGHDGIVKDGAILNDETVRVLCKQALCHARALVDIIAPSDMMDGRIGAIRDTLDENGFKHVSLLSYTAKYASGFYSPFREALDSTPKFGDKKTYQMDPANAREALREAALDEDEGADIMMVKPAMPYLDILCRMRRETNLPLAAYQVSGEYAMLKAASQNGWLDEKSVVMESLMSFLRISHDKQPGG